MTDHQTARRLAALDQVLILTHRRARWGHHRLCQRPVPGAPGSWEKPPGSCPMRTPTVFHPLSGGCPGPGGVSAPACRGGGCGVLGMLPDSAGAYKDRIDLVIDHHGSNEGYGRETCVDPSCAACGELLYRIFQAMAISFTPEIAMLLYMAIATDTGCFVYSNTTPETHRIAAALMAVGFDAQWVNRRHFRVKSLKRMRLEGRLVQEMELAQGGTLAFAYVTPGSHRRSPGHRGGFGGYLLLHRSGGRGGQRGHHPPAVPQECKISLRTDGKTLNASAVCALHGEGGGHPAAAGCTIWGPRPGQSSHAGRH